MPDLKPLTPREHLLAAAKLLEEKGSCAYARKNLAGQFCALGALDYVISGSAVNGSEHVAPGAVNTLDAHLKKTSTDYVRDQYNLTKWIPSRIANWFNSLVVEGKAALAIQTFRDAAKALTE